MAVWESNTESGGSFMRLNTKNQGWAYSIGRLWSQVRAGSFYPIFFKLKALYSGRLFTHSEGSLPSLSNPAEGSLFPSSC